MTNVVTDLRYAVRSLGKARGFSGIGANVVMFSVVDTVLLPYTDPDRLVSFTAPNMKTGAEYNIPGMPDVVDIRSESDIFEAVAAYQTTTAVRCGDEAVERVKARQVSGELPARSRNGIAIQ